MSDQEQANYVATIIWRLVYVALAFAFLGAIGYVYIMMHEATNPKTGVQPDRSLYIVQQSHENGQYLQVEHDGQTFVLRCVNLECYAYSEGERLSLQLMCTNGVANLYKQWDNGEGEYWYHSDGFELDRKVCPQGD